MKLFCAILIGMVLFCASAFAQKNSPFLGTWELDQTQSKLSPDTAIKSLTVVISQESPQMYSWHGSGKANDGKPVDIAWSGPEDGSMHPTIQEGKPSFSQSARKEGKAVHRHGEWDGGSFDARMTVSADGITLVDEIESVSKDGKETREKDVFHRVSAHH
jgi:hypothetical protein